MSQSQPTPPLLNRLPNRAGRTHHRSTSSPPSLPTGPVVATSRQPGGLPCQPSLRPAVTRSRTRFVSVFDDLRARRAPTEMYGVVTGLRAALIGRQSDASENERHPGGGGVQERRRNYSVLGGYLSGGFCRRSFGFSSCLMGTIQSGSVGWRIVQEPGSGKMLVRHVGARFYFANAASVACEMDFQRRKTHVTAFVQ